MESDIIVPIHEIVVYGFVAFLCFYIIFSLILQYHWRSYATDARVTRITLLSYYALTVPLLAVMGLMTFIIW